MSSTTDLTSFRLVWIVDGITYTWGWRWAPAAAVAHRTERGTVNYQAWVEGGHLIMTEGDSVDYSVIEEKIRWAFEEFNIQVVAFDSWNAADLINRLLKDQLPMIQFIQGFRSYHPALQALEVSYISKKLAHGGDPVLLWCASNLVYRYDSNMSTAPDKKRSADKIDDYAALAMARGVAITEEEDDNEDFMEGIRDPMIA